VFSSPSLHFLYDPKQVREFHTVDINGGKMCAHCRGIIANRRLVATSNNARVS
jgi:hypothetical protein